MNPYGIQDAYQKAIAFAGIAHKDQKIPGSDVSYVVHLANVAMEVLFAYSESMDFDLETALQSALLHDTLEDTDISFEDLQKNFGGKVAECVHSLTKNMNLPKEDRMKDSLNRILKQGRDACIVKLADRITNLQIPPSYWSNEKKKQYLAEAELILNMLQNTHSYLENRLRARIKIYLNYLY
ncbi:MAG TPA: HD domain-containing protein [Leptospiraceae bacterium]|nr:HD domain-containing protein [Leptospiraceae bacterium]HMY70184.1 HD domain-containing protein [Leptospiraceae bacterium]HNF13670.1 HD domain-containing protein [Leptospiraceae bacterium]HNF27546.1 HD domain-containing protein [Leptospiraceae bacterium]HNI28296.1 HD domain-containing protein [Leptospiraceae bacterium]